MKNFFWRIVEWLFPQCKQERLAKERRIARRREERDAEGHGEDPLFNLSDQALEKIDTLRAPPGTKKTDRLWKSLPERVLDDEVQEVES